jgi:hypothetical protein
MMFLRKQYVKQEASRLFHVSSCFSCGEKGHISPNCPHRDEDNDDKQGEKKTANTNKKKGNASVVTRQYKVLCAKTKSLTNQGVWILDGGASDHMTPRKELLRDYEPMSGEVSIGDGRLLKIVGKGKLLLHISEECGNSDLDFLEVLHVPGLSDNLISQGMLDDRGLEIQTVRGVSKIFDGEDLLLQAHKVGKLYFITTTSSESISDLNSKYQAELKKASLATLETWHNRFGHLSEDALLKIPCIAESVKSRSRNDCDVCIMGKKKKESYPKEGDSETSRALERIHSDVAGPISPQSLGGRKYYVTFLDDFTNFLVTFPMKRKSEVYQLFEKYQRRSESIHDSKIVEFQSDNGREYMNDKFTTQFDKCGILHRRTVPGCPSQNGKAERINQTLLNVVRCLLYRSGVPLYFWAEALQTATFLRNLSPSTSVDNQIPFELWHGAEVTLKFLKRLKIFGCQAWAYTNDGSKLSPRAVECVFLGYPEGVKGWKLYSLKDQKIILSRSVHFNEGKFPFLDRKRIAGTPERMDLLTSKEEEDSEEDGTDSESEEGNQTDSEDQETEEENDYDEVPAHEEEDQEVVLQMEGVQVPPVLIPPALGAEEQYSPHRAGGNEGGNIPVPRRSTRERVEKKPCTLPCCMIAKKYDVNIKIPTSLQEALNSPESEDWIAAMLEEMNVIWKMNTYDIVRKEKNMNIVGCKWVFTAKRNHSGAIVKLKARLVARGYAQIEGLDFDDTYSPVMRKRCLRILIALAVENDWEIHQVDIVSAYLNSPIDVPVYMEQPPYFDKEYDPKSFVCKLSKSLYGLKQSGRNWNSYLHQCLLEIGLIQSEHDHCIYYSEGLIIGVHVDDMLVIGETSKIVEFKESIKEIMDIKDLGEASMILSVRVKYEDGSVIIDQSQYAEEVLSRFDTEDCYGRPAPLPIQAGLRKAATEDDLCDNTLYRRAIGSLQYLAQVTRADIAFATSKLSQYLEKPTNEDWKNV